MTNPNFSDFKLVVYKEDKPIGIYKPDYIGLLGLHIKDKNVEFAKNGSFEIGVIGPEKMCLDNTRIPVIVSSITENGIGLRLQRYDSVVLERWRSILSTMLSALKNKEYTNVATSV